MTDRERTTHDKQVERSKERRSRNPESEATPATLHARETDPFSLTETTFAPRTNDHLAVLSRVTPGVQRGFIIQLQRVYGNRYVQRLLRTMEAQAKLTVSQPDDPYEREANRVAETVARTPTEESKAVSEEEVQPKLQRQAPFEEEEKDVQAKADQVVPEVTEELEKRISSERGGGQTLGERVRRSLEPAFDRDFSDVKIHTDSEASKLSSELGAEAFTSGTDVFFREGAYQPESEQGKKLIAHELTHVVQQGAGVQKASSLIQRWGPSDHKKITKEKVSESLKGSMPLGIDEEKLDLLASSATQMDLKAPELNFNIGGKILGLTTIDKQKGVERLQQYYSENVENALNHGEGGLYSMDSTSAAAENVKNQDIYIKDAEDTYYRSLKSGRGFDTKSTDAVIGALGDAFHVAEDRGSHGEGAEGKGHAGEILTGKNPDKRGTNPDGWSDAETNTSAIAKKKSFILGSCLSPQIKLNEPEPGKESKELERQVVEEEEEESVAQRQLTSVAQRQVEQEKDLEEPPPLSYTSLPTEVQSKYGQKTYENDLQNPSDGPGVRVTIIGLYRLLKNAGVDWDSQIGRVKWVGMGTMDVIPETTVYSLRKYLVALGFESKYFAADKEQGDVWGLRKTVNGVGLHIRGKINGVVNFHLDLSPPIWWKAFGLVHYIQDSKRRKKTVTPETIRKAIEVENSL